MPSPKVNRKLSHEKNKKGKLSEKASSFHCRGDKIVEEMTALHRPRTVPDLLAGRRSPDEEAPPPPGKSPAKLTKMLINVTIQRSPGAVQVVVSPEATVDDLIAAALRQYAKEARRPVFSSTECSGFQLHYSQFSLESLGGEEKVIALGSRNFFMCPKSAGSAASTSNCSKEAHKPTEKGLSWLKFMDFLL